jgi:hypothetical protein
MNKIAILLLAAATIAAGPAGAGDDYGGAMPVDLLHSDNSDTVGSGDPTAHECPWVESSADDEDWGNPGHKY